MLSRSTWLHLRIPFSYFLLPVYLFAVALSPNLDIPRLIWSFVIIHLLLYPASNAYNSYFDKDEKSIGGLKNPPPVSRELYFTALFMDALAIILGFITISATFAVMLLIYGIVSKMYSHPMIRLKKLPYTSWLTAGIFQGLFTFIMSYSGINDFDFQTVLQPRILMAGTLTSLMLMGSYPMTQVYQHEEDGKRNDRTLSIVLGIRGTFIFVQALFTFSALAFVLFFRAFYSVWNGYYLLLALLPVMIFFMIWFTQVWHNEAKADFNNTMRLNFISATCLNGFFVYLFFSNHTFN